MGNYYESPFKSNRVRQQFGEAFDPGPSLMDWSPQQQTPEPDSNRYYSDVRRLYGSTPALDAYREHLGAMPNQEDYKPSGWERLAAGLSGFSVGLKDAGRGIQVAQGMNRSRYNTALENYYNTAKPLGEAANLERQGIDDQVSAIMQANELGLKYDDYRRQVQKDEDDFNIRTGELGVKRGELGVKQGELGHKINYDTKRLGQFDRDVNSLVDYRRTTAGAQARNAETNFLNMSNQGDRWRAQTQQGWEGLNIDRQRANAYDKIAGSRGAQNLPSGTDMKNFEQSTLGNMKATYPDFIELDANGDYVLGAPPDMTRDPAGYQAYRQMVEQVQSQLNSRTQGRIDFGFGDGGLGDVDFLGVRPE